MTTYYKIEKHHIQLDYYYHEKIYYYDYFCELDNFSKSLKFNIIDLGLEPKKYVSRADQYKLNPLRQELYKMLDYELLKYPIESFTKIIMRLISDKIYRKDICIYQKNTNEDQNYLFRDIREYDLQIKVLKLLIERRLELDNTCQLSKGKKNLNLIISIASFLYKFNMCMDFMYYELDFGYVEIDTRYNIIIHLNKIDYNIKYIENNYDASEKVLTDDIIQEFIMNYEFDLGFHINEFIEISSCLCVDIPKKLYYSHKNNIVKIKKEKLIKLISRYNQDNLKNDTINKVVDYLTINRKDVIAQYKREEQSNRLDQRPIICYDDTLYYSPALLSQIYSRFIHSIYIYDFPYNTNMPNVCKTLEKMKKKSEKMIVQDVAKIIKTNTTGPIYVEKKLHQINCMIDKNISESVGDYDILAMDTNKKIIYNIEIKNLKLFTTTYEMYRQYYAFYHKHKYEIKFTKRIETLKEYYKTIFPNCFNDDISTYEIRNIILTNKNFIPKIDKNKDITYICYSMLEDYLNFDNIVSGIKLYNNDYYIF